MDLDEASPRVALDEIQIQQVLVNLIRDASDAMREMPDSNRVVIVSTRALQDGAVELAVTDRGKGLSQEELEKVFDAFFSTKPDGMGLPISRSIVEAHGGRLWARANDGPGLTFRFSISRDIGEGQKTRPEFETV